MKYKCCDVLSGITYRSSTIHQFIGWKYREVAVFRLYESFKSRILFAEHHQSIPQLLADIVISDYPCNVDAVSAEIC